MKRFRLPGFLILLSVFAPNGSLADVSADCRTGSGTTAIEACSSLLTTDPSHAVDWYSLRARARLGIGDDNGALEDVSRAIALDPVAGTAYAVRAQINLQLGEIDSAQRDAGFAVTLAPDDFAAHLVQGRVLAAVGAWDSARQSFDKAAVLAPDGAARATVTAATAEALAAQETTAIADTGGDTQTPAPGMVETRDPITEETTETGGSGGEKGKVSDTEGAGGASPEELAFWNSVKDSRYGEELRAYLDAYPDGAFAGLARVRLQRLTRDAQAPPVPVAADDPENSPIVARCDQAAAHPSNSDNPSGLEPTSWPDIDAADSIAKCRAALEIFPNHDRTAYHLGRAYHAAGDLTNAERYLKHAAENDYVQALAGLGILYRDETGLGEPQSAAVGYFVRAAKLGDEFSQLQAAWAYYRGTGIEKDYLASARWFLAAAEQGNHEAQTELGWQFANGLGVAEDQAQAVHWYRLAADQGNRVAQNNLGHAYEKGLGGLKPSDTEAVFWYRKAAELGNPIAQVNLGWMYEFGRGVQKNAEEAVNWYRLGADQGNARAQTNLGWMYESGTGVAKNLRKAVEYYRLAADQNFPRAQVNLAWMYENGRGIAENKRLALTLYRKAASQKDARAQMELGRLFLYSIGTKKDVDKALLWLRRSAAQEYSRAYTFLGHLFETETDHYSAAKAAANYFKALKAGEEFPVTRAGPEWDKRTARALQKRLKDAGYYDGKLDGIVGRGTIQAMKALCNCG